MARSTGRRSGRPVKDRSSAKRDRARKKAKHTKKEIIAVDTIFINSRAQRIVHWYTAAAFFLTALTGTFILFKLDVIPLERPTEKMIMLHTGLGFGFLAGLVLVMLQWLPKALRFKKLDVEWIARLGGYFRKNSPVPPAERLNAGQKIWTILFSGTACVAVASGLILWLVQHPAGSAIPHETHRLAISLHTCAYSFLILFFLIHVYFSTIATPGTFAAMWGGRVRIDWARIHHSLWYEKAAESSGLAEEKHRRMREKTLERKKKRIMSARKSAALKTASGRSAAARGAKTPLKKDPKKFGFKEPPVGEEDLLEVEEVVAAEEIYDDDEEFYDDDVVEAEEIEDDDEEFDPDDDEIVDAIAIEEEEEDEEEED